MSPLSSKSWQKGLVTLVELASCTKKYQAPQLTHRRATEMLDELLIAFQKDESQKALHNAYMEGQGNTVKIEKARMEIVHKAYSLIFGKYGFEHSHRGIVDWWDAMAAHKDRDPVMWDKLQLLFFGSSSSGRILCGCVTHECQKKRRKQLGKSYQGGCN